MSTELPVRATPVADFTSMIGPACALLAQSDDGAPARLAAIARDYIDGRRSQHERVPQPDCRRSLEKLSAVAAHCCEALGDVPATHQHFFNCAIKDQPSPAELPSKLGTAFLELADYDPLIWLPTASAELRAALSRLRCLLEELGSRCAALPMQAEWALIELEQNSSLDSEADGPRSLYTLIDTLRTNASMAAESMKSARGPRSDTVRMRAVLRLKEEFAGHGLPTTHNPNDAADYVGIGSSPFDRFVHTFFVAVEPGDTQRRGLNDAVAFACRPGRVARAAGSESGDRSEPDVPSGC